VTGRRNRRSEPVPVGALLPRLLGDLSSGAASLVIRIWERWEEAVGPEVAAHSRPLALRGDELEVAVESSVWSQELQLRTPQILTGLREVFGEAAPSKLRLQVARVDGRERGSRR
jgi:predicted nucleic acid-binding Zn ribbon protein